MKRGKARLHESIEFARTQRKASNEFAATVWQWIRNRQCCEQKFRREVPIPPYTVDFCCVDLKLVIEIDGEPHFSDERVESDRKRDQYLRSMGYQIFRIHGYDVIRDGGDVIERMREFVQGAIDITNPSPPAPHPQRGEGSENCICALFPQRRAGSQEKNSGNATWTKQPWCPFAPGCAVEQGWG